MEREPQRTKERAVLLLRAALLPAWRPTTGQALVWAIRGAVVLGIIVLIASAVDRTLWDWLNLLIVPVLLAIGGYLFNNSQNRRAQDVAEQDRQDESLRAYLDNISGMLLDPDRPLHRARPGDRLSVVARARTLPVLRRLDTGRKRIVVQFLYESGLIAKDRLVIDLNRADLTNAGLNELHLENACLNGVFLTEASLNGALLEGACLRKVWMQGASLRGAHLVGADLRGASLKGADLRGADLSQADLRPEPDLKEEIDVLWPGLVGADLSAANLHGARLQGADLRSAVLHPAALDPPEDPSSVEASLYEEYFKDADLTDASLSGADLTGALITRKQLAECRSLESATMPDGQTYYEGWLKDK